MKDENSFEEKFNNDLKSSVSCHKSLIPRKDFAKLAIAFDLAFQISLQGQNNHQYGELKFCVVILKLNCNI